ncbi:hypothetical protein HCZ23_00850 [Celeribacter sp. HF31]|uniref:hypothetical protein n=1 Tax=Celeribacter sp. HF31 TaxID=2721558 RepID=UPI001430EEBA|nr:hypothetical protein [Celeribacter sp. HF31]NIY78020.1 hypothetical protein [Celeribacter sp. HF31]
MTKINPALAFADKESPYYCVSKDETPELRAAFDRMKPIFYLVLALYIVVPYAICKLGGPAVFIAIRQSLSWAPMPLALFDRLAATSQYAGCHLFIMTAMVFVTAPAQALLYYRVFVEKVVKAGTTLPLGPLWLSGYWRQVRGTLPIFILVLIVPYVLLLSEDRPPVIFMWPWIAAAMFGAHIFGFTPLYLLLVILKKRKLKL